MARRVGTLVGVLLVATLFAAPAFAQYPDPWVAGPCDPDGHALQYWPRDARTTFYPMYLAVDEVASNGFIFVVYIYAEGNDVAGLQRDDAYCYDPGYRGGLADSLFW